MRRHAMTILMCGLALALTQCALGQSEIDVATRAPKAPPPRQAVAIIEIRDLRSFQVDPGRPELPSLPSEAAIKDSRSTARTVGRTRNAYNMKLGDVVLPENQTVAGLVRDAVTTALREQGYAVVNDPAPGVLPLSVDIQQFWAWFEPGLLTVNLEFVSHLLIYGQGVVARSPMFVQGRASATDAVATAGTWSQVVQQGLDNLVLNIRNRVEPATVSPSIATVPKP
jgi:hypothetical protein